VAVETRPSQQQPHQHRQGQNTPGVAADTQPAERPAQRPGLKLGFLTRLEVGADPADSYKFAMDMFMLGEELGFDTGWIAQHHFLNGDGRLPSVLPFLAAAAQRTKRIHLGTAVITLPLDDPLRVAEDAAFVDTISGGRLQLGLGTGGDPVSFNAFGKDVKARREAYAEGFKIVRDALLGKPINGTEAVMYPTAPSLVDRIWEATFSEDGGARIGRNGSGLLVSKTSAHSGDPADVVQKPIALAYERELAARPGPRPAPRVGMSRSVYVAADRATAMAHLRTGVAAWAAELTRRGQLPAGLGEEETFKRIPFHCGGPEDVIASVRSDLLFAHATELICQVQPGEPTQQQILKSMELLAKEVAPALGWRPR
jgi:putative FMN-dependent luciferase-like monooxygenase